MGSVHTICQRTGGDNSTLFTKEPVDTESERFKLLIGAYLYDQLPDYSSEFVKWAKQVKGITLTINPEVSTGFSMLAD